MKHYCRLTKITVLLFAALLLTGCSGIGQTTAESVGLSGERLERIDELLQRHVDEQQVAGASALIVRKGKTGYFRTFGMRDVKDNLPMEEDTIFRIYSMTKPITSTAVSEVVDSSGNGLDGKLAGNAKIITDPERGNVLSLDGSGYVDCINNPAFDITASITVAVWIKVNAFDKEYQSIVSGGVSSWKIYRQGLTNDLSFVCGGPLDNTCTSLTGNVNDGKWHHVVGTYDGQKLCLYIDGNINNSVNATGLINLDQENVYIGTMSKDISTEFNGLIDDVRIYSYALSQDDITAIYAGDDIGN